jgi:hypothetical protein
LRVPSWAIWPGTVEQPELDQQAGGGAKTEGQQVEEQGAVVLVSMVITRP